MGPRLFHFIIFTLCASLIAASGVLYTYLSLSLTNTSPDQRKVECNFVFGRGKCDHVGAHILGYVQETWVEAITIVRWESSKWRADNNEQWFLQALSWICMLYCIPGIDEGGGHPKRGGAKMGPQEEASLQYGPNCIMTLCLMISVILL